MHLPTLRPILICASLSVCAAPLSSARFAAPDLKDIPLARLVENLEAKVEGAPDDPAAHHHLARAHAMAFAKDLGAEDIVKLNNRGKPNAIWFGYTPPHVPFVRGANPGDAKKSDEALKHLEKAIAQYEKALELKPKDALVIQLGLAWCRSQAGDKEKAITGLRDVIEEAWKKDGTAKHGGMREFMTAEAIGYLKPLLDVDKDAEEIATLAKREKQLRALPRAITPIAIPLLDRIGVAEMVDADAEVGFDLDGSGETGRRWQWLRAGEAAWLVHDPAGEGVISSGLQMFGNRTFTMFFEHGYEALSVLDDDADGALRGAELRGLALWHDLDADGVSSSSEVRPIGEWGIVGLRCDSEINGDGVRFSQNGVEYADGQIRSSFDLVLDSQPSGDEPGGDRR